MRIVGISGKIGSGKNYLTDKFISEMDKRKLVVTQTSFALPLKSEINDVIKLIRDNRLVSRADLASIISEGMRITLSEAEVLIDCLYTEVTNDEALDGYSRTFGIRDSLQKFGTGIRRKQNPAYWTDKFLTHVASLNADIVLVSDARFPNEMDTIVDHGGYAMRINLPQDVLERRRASRDGVIYTLEQLNHVSETALDDYERFSVIVGETFDIVELANGVLSDK